MDRLIYRLSHDFHDSTMILGYNTNGFACHPPFQAIDILGEIGYRSLAITIDHQWLNPYSDSFSEQLEAFRLKLAEWSMSSVIETGARFLLDPRHKHEPTLLSPRREDRAQRIDFLCRCIEIAGELNSRCVSLWSGKLNEPCDTQTAMDRLGNALQPVVEHARDHNVALGFEPEPGMFIDSMAGFERLCQWVETAPLQLTLDVGHLFCQGEVPIANFIHRFRDRIVNVHIEDMRAGIHDHLLFGEGDIFFPPVLKAFQEINYTGPLHVELSRHSHDAVNTAHRAFEFLNSILQTDLQSSS